MNQQGLKTYMKNKGKSHFTWRGIEVVIKDPLPVDVPIDVVLEKLSKMLPGKFLTSIDGIYVGVWPELQSRELQAMYEHGAIYITNSQTNVGDMLNDLVHEIAHSLEERNAGNIYGDNKLESEFLIKRQHLRTSLESEGYQVPDLNYFLEVEYNRDFDNYLYNNIGYSLLSLMTVNLFYSPYAATSLREYYANGFEALYYHKDPGRLSSLSPILLDKLKNLK